MKMRSSSIATYLIAFWLGLLAVNCFDKLVMIRQRPSKPGDPYILTCVSDNNHAVLVWNDDLGNPTEYIDAGPTKSQTPRNCVIVDRGTCIIDRKKVGDWKIVNSAEYPMQPVIYSRWEDFSGKSFTRHHITYEYVRNISSSGTVVFSARGLGSLNLLLCGVKHKIPSDNVCFCVTIAADTNGLSKIGFCADQWTESNHPSRGSCRTAEKCAKYSPSVIDVFEWRTFTLAWKKKTMEIKVHGGSNFMLQKRFDTWPKFNQLFVQSSDAGRIRFHFYDYLLTRITNSKLTSRGIYLSSNRLCAELWINLCTQCKLRVSIYNNHTSQMAISSYTWSVEPPANSILQDWRVVRMDITLPNFTSGHVTLEFSAVLHQNSYAGRWAIGSFRLCDPAVSGTRKVSTITFNPRHSTPPHVPIINCQQLSNTPIPTISSNTAITPYISSNPSKCIPSKVGTSCLLGCTNNQSCRGTSVCDQSGCVCTPGLKNSADCDEECPDGRHGYDCQEHCGSCKTGTCDKSDGSCLSGCSGYHLPPDCKKKLEAPIVMNVNTTTVLLRHTELDPERIGNISFQIQCSNNVCRTRGWANITAIPVNSDHPIMYEARIGNLSPDMLYYGLTVFTTTSGLQVKGPETKFTTVSCEGISGPKDFTVIAQGNGVVKLRWNYPSNSNQTVKKFLVYIKRLKTSLRNDPGVDLEIYKSYTIENLGTYGPMFYLRTATEYNFLVEANTANECKKAVLTKQRTQASLGFAGKQELEVNRTRYFMKIKLPSVVNDTLNSVLRVIVKGSTTCKSSPVPDNVKALMNITDSEKVWVAATFPDPKNRPEYLTIGKDPNDEESKNCPLSPEATYVVVVAVIDSVDKVGATITSSPMLPTVDETTNQLATESHGKSSLVWLTIPLILLICILIIFIWRHKFMTTLRRVNRQNIVTYSPNLPNFFKSSPSSASDEAESFGIVSTSETVASNRYPHSFNIKHFEDYVRNSITNGQLKSQFETFPKGLTRPTKYGSLPENKSKNRYENIIPYDNTRVILKKLPDDPFSDYINANYVQGVRKKRAYIAAQGPTTHTVVDFWRMIWQEEALVICMLANIVERGKSKCEQYWPEFGASKTYGNITIVNEDRQIFADFTFRTFRVSCKEETRRIEHLHYTGWPDHMVPLYPHSLIAYLKKLQSTTPIEKGPIVVHCSAGVGRTGTVILCDICLRRVFTKGAIDVLAEFKKLRRCRPNMVDNNLQYIFAHVVLTECLASLPTDLPCNNKLPQAIEKLKNELPKHIERLRETAWKDQALRSQVLTVPALPQQLAKNRFPELAPGSSLIYLRRYPTRDVDSDYISAVIVDGVRVKRQYLASQLPLPSTLSDFWRLIAEQKIELVVILQQPALNDPTCCDIIPEEESFDPVPFINVEPRTSSHPEKSPRIDEILLTDTSGGTRRTQSVTVLTCLEWGLGKNGKPPPPTKLVELWMASENIHREKGPTLVLCHDGLTGCGLYLALSFLLERMAVERQCDIIFAIRAIRRSRPDFVQSQAQFEYLYDAAVKYIESFETYANFA